MKTNYKLLCLSLLTIVLFPFWATRAQHVVFHNKIDTISAGYYNYTSYINYSFHFKNINKTAYYRSESGLASIEKWEKKSDFRRLIPVMEEYVSNFGIQNFYKDTHLLWRLAQLYEQDGQVDKAKSLYRLVLKHHRGKTDKVLQYYNMLIENDQDYYVPISHYYNMVEARKSIDTLRPPPGVFTNMGTEINSDQEDYAPSLSDYGDTIIFTSKRNRGQNQLARTSNEDLYISRKIDGYWYYSEPLKEINTIYNEGSAFLSKDKKTIYFSRCYAPNGYGNCDIFVADWLEESQRWGNVRNLGANINGNAWDSQPSLSPSGDTLFFASDRLGGFGLSDIYYSIKQRNGEWLPAQNMGPVVNTRFNEVSPYYHGLYKVLYFSSDGQLVNFGGFDIYKSYFRGNLWLEPKNIGPLVNGVGNEYYFTIDSKSRDLYYARSEEDFRRRMMNGDSSEIKNIKPEVFGSPYPTAALAAKIENLDIYSFPLPMDAKPNAVTHFRGSLTDSSGVPFKGVVSIIDLDHGVEISPKKLRPDGTFDFDLIKNNNYLIVIQGEEFFRVQQNFFLRRDTVVNATTESIRSRKIRFTTIEFKEGSWEILSSMYGDLDNVYNFLIDNPRFKLKIAGHTDRTGDHDFNLSLSQSRAEAIKNYLIADGQIDPKRISAIGYGSSKPIVIDEKTDIDKRTNRRVEFEISR